MNHPSECPWEQICHLASIQNKPHNVQLEAYICQNELAEQAIDIRMYASIYVLFDLISKDMQSLPIANNDVSIVDNCILHIDKLLSQQMDAILHHPEVQALESLYKGLEYLLNNSPKQTDVQYELLDCNQTILLEDFEEVLDIRQSTLYKHVYTQEYDTPGGEPFAAMVAPFEVSSELRDIQLMEHITRVGELTHCPFIANVGPRFFNKQDFAEVLAIDDITQYMQRTEFLAWQRFRQTESSRYLGLVLPKFLLRLPHAPGEMRGSFRYQEQTCKLDASEYLWGSGSFAFALNLSKSFSDYGWCVNIRGPESGGRVSGLLLHQYQYGGGVRTKIPTQALISESQELAFSNLGLIPLSYYKNSDYACFFSANSAQNPQVFHEDKATANSRINARLPYVFLSSRLAHYLKVLQRENIGANKSCQELEHELNHWLATLVTRMNNPGQALVATHPLREAFVEVTPLTDNPGVYRVQLFAMPHFQIEGLDIHLSLVSQLPGKEIH